MTRLLWICLGGALGTGARYLLAGWTLKVLGSSFPFGTLAVNLVGSTLLAGLMVVGTETSAMSPTLRLALTTGVMGGFTTYSTFSYETMKYIQEDAWAWGFLNILVTVVGCLAACFLGAAAGKWIIGHQPF
jgi:fluoride exporter